MFSPPTEVLLPKGFMIVKVLELIEHVAKLDNPVDDASLQLLLATVYSKNSFGN